MVSESHYFHNKTKRRKRNRKSGFLKAIKVIDHPQPEVADQQINERG